MSKDFFKKKGERICVKDKNFALPGREKLKLYSVLITVGHLKHSHKSIID